jgi:hypothetical protein
MTASSVAGRMRRNEAVRRSRSELLAPIPDA